MNKRLLALMVIAVAALGAALLFKNNSKSTQPETTTSSSASTQVAGRGSQNFYGKLDSPVTLTEFVDFQCASCYAYYPHVKEVKEKYKDRVRFQVRNFPIASHHQYSVLGAKNAEAAARQGKFWDMHNAIFENQTTWSQSSSPQSYFDDYAKQIGLDFTKFKADIESQDVLAVINEDLQDVNKLGGSGTPTFVLNGKKIGNPPPNVEAFSLLLDEALAEADNR